MSTVDNEVLTEAAHTITDLIGDMSAMLVEEDVDAIESTFRRISEVALDGAANVRLRRTAS